MHVVLRAVNLSSGERQIVVRMGQVLRVGRTEWADFCVAGDDLMGDVHFEIQCDETSCRVRDLGSGRDTLLNDEVITEATVRSGDRVLAGKTSFVIEIESGPGGAEAGEGDAAAESPVEQQRAAGFTHVAAATVREVCDRLDFCDETLCLLDDNTSPKEFVERLVGAERFADAIRFLAHAMPKREAVWWAARCVDDVLIENRTTDVAALEAARRWVVDTTDDNRRAAGAAADATKLTTAAGMTAISAYWSGGSIAPPGSPDIPPDPSMTANGISGAVVLAASEDNGEDILEVFRRFIQYGTAVADGEDRWEES
jgi:hypothetical protein